MPNRLSGLTEADISARCTEASLRRGWNYYKGNAVRQRMRTERGIEARVSGTNVYRVTVQATSGGLATMCTCPYDWGGDCKHIVATLLAWMHEPESFRTAKELQTALAARTKKELVSILTDICEVYPHLAAEFGLLNKPAEYDPEAVVKQIFSSWLQSDYIDVAAGVARMESVARQAARLVRQGQADLARRTYYALVRQCMDFCQNFGADDIFPLNIPYDFALAYRDLALDQLEEQAETVEREVQRMLKGDWAPVMLGIEDPLMDVWIALEQ